MPADQRRGLDERLPVPSKVSAGDAQGGRGPSCGGSRLHGSASAVLLARDVLAGVGGTRPPRLSPEGKRERGVPNHFNQGVTEYRRS